MLIVRPKLVHAVENSSRLSCMSQALPTFRAQSSANRSNGSIMTYSGYMDRNLGLKAMHVEQVAICLLLDVDARVSVLKGICQHCRKHHAEQCGGKHTSLLHCVCYWEGRSPSSSTQCSCGNGILYKLVFQGNQIFQSPS